MADALAAAAVGVILAAAGEVAGGGWEVAVKEG